MTIPELSDSYTDPDNILGEVAEIKKEIPLEPSEALAVFVEPLNKLSGRIVELSRTTGEKFLSVGMKVQEYSDMASWITSSALTASRIMSSDDLRTAMEGLSGMVDQLEDIFHCVDAVSSGNMETLKSIGLTVKAVEKELESLGDTSKDLKMLALSTKIQSTKTGEGSSAFMQLGDDIGKMSVIISSKAKDLLSETANLSKFVKDVHGTLYELMSSQEYQTESVLKWTRNIIESMSDQSAKSKKEGERIRLISEQISHSVSDMVTFVQYQDITSQSFEKVIEGLCPEREVPKNHGSYESEPLSTGPAIPDEIVLTGQLFIQARRLENTDNIIQEALGKMILSLEMTTGNIKEMTAVTKVVNTDSTHFLDELETAISTVTSFLQEMVQSSREMSESMSSLANTVESMSEFAEDIDAINSDVELISLNARIMAAQAGIEAAGMGIIAEAVKNTAGHSNEQRISVVGKLNEISRVSVDLKEKMENVTRGDEVKLDQLVRELGVFLDALRTMQKKILSMLCDMDQNGVELVNAIDSSVDGIRDHDHFTRESADIASKIKDLASNCIGTIKLQDLSFIAGDRFREEELRQMDHQHRLELVEAFLMEHNLGGPSEESDAGFSVEGEIELFDNEI